MTEAEKERCTSGRHPMDQLCSVFYEREGKLLHIAIAEPTVQVPDLVTGQDYMFYCGSTIKLPLAAYYHS